jgi:hypothetical protein
MLAGYALGRSITLFNLLARTATLNSGDQNGESFEFLHVIIKVTAASATPSVVFRIQGKDPASGDWYDILVSAAITGAGTTVLKVGPGLTAAANLVANDMIPSVWRLRAEHADADSITYSAGANFG